MPDAAKSTSLAERLVAGDKRALARAITLIESDDPAGWELVREVYPRTGKARIVGFTGPPGVGKSTLIGALTAELRKADRQVAVLSIDPSSPFTRGALLGDRIRLSDHFLDPGVFIRSMASRGALGGLSEAALQVALAMDAAGKDDVLIETVGVGQAEIDIVDHADTIVLALSHEPGGWQVPILRTEAARGEGVAELAVKIDEHRAHIEAEGTLEQRRARNLRNEVLGIATSRMRRRMEATAAADSETARLLERVVRRELDPASAASELMERQSGE
jgi:LAO/AO transport system kinase